MKKRDAMGNITLFLLTWSDSAPMPICDIARNLIIVNTFGAVNALAFEYIYIVGDVKEAATIFFWNIKLTIIPAIFLIEWTI